MESVGGSITGITRNYKNKGNYIPQKSYECVSYRKYGRAKCVCHNIKEDILLENFKKLLLLFRDNYIDEINSIKLKEHKSSEKKDMDKLKINLKSLEAEYKILISQKIKEIASSSEDKREFIENTYKNLEEEKYNEMVKEKNKLQELENKNLERRKEKINKAIDYFNKIIYAEIPDKAILNMLIDKIYIYHDKSAKLELKIDIEKLI